MARPVAQQQRRHRRPRHKGTAGKPQQARRRLCRPLWRDHHEREARVWNPRGHQGSPPRRHAVRDALPSGAFHGLPVHALALDKDKAEGAGHGAKQRQVGDAGLGDAAGHEEHDQDERVDPADVVVHEDAAHALGGVHVLAAADGDVPKVAAQAEEEGAPKAHDGVDVARGRWVEGGVAGGAADEEPHVQRHKRADEQKEGDAQQRPGEEEQYFEQFIGGEWVLDVEKGRAIDQRAQGVELDRRHAGGHAQVVELIAGEGIEQWLLSLCR